MEYDYNKGGAPKGNLNAQKEKVRDGLLKVPCYREEEKAVWNYAARQEGMSLSGWVRKHLNEAVKDIDKPWEKK